MPAPKVSILIPTYNYGRYLPEALDSILLQEFQDFEVIISDDASIDNTAEIISRYTDHDLRFQFHRQEANLGMVANWNWCLQQARGEYVQYLFGDDFLISPKALVTLSDRLDQHPQAGLAVSARRLTDDCSRLGIKAADLGRSGVYRGRDAIRRCLLTSQNLIGEPSVVMFRKQLGVRGFDCQYKQLVDLEMWFHLCDQSDLIFVSEPLCAFRQHNSQQTVVNARDDSTRLEMFNLFKSYERYVSRDAGGFIAQMESFTTFYDMIKGMRRSTDLSAEMHDRVRYLESLIPWYWIPLTFANYRIRKQYRTTRRSIAKRFGHIN